MYAPVLQSIGVKHNLDPVTVIVLMAGESSNNSSKVNSINCVGLGQICVEANYAYCKPGKGYNKAQCDAKIAQLKNPIYNLRTTAAGITANRKYCNKKTKKRTKKSRNQWRHWMPSYGGYNNYGKRWKGVWCGQRKVKGKWKNAKIPKRIRGYMERRKRIIQAVSRKLRRKRR